ncbi:hypothetical protein ACHHYP_15598 [Achlya hypogyna]|uniref:WW domain-containing protein n=1 Tax=Achlya hypogyna TaxID=1202772 RepID=A0A1V9YAI0_ACHHY|nr:hypothetical protein ACHHYP_15598 [Achlya hypogyna]
MATDEMIAEDLVLRNVNPFGVVFTEHQGPDAREADAHGAYCATGDYGSLEYWEKVTQDQDTFYFCKARNVSMWGPPCRIFVAAYHTSDPHGEDMTITFPLSYEPLEYRREERQPATPPQPAPTPAPAPMDLSQILATLQPAELGERYLQPLFQFKGPLDGIGAVGVRSKFPPVPLEFRPRAELSSSEVNALFCAMARNLILAEAKMETSAQEHHDTPKLMSVEDIDSEQRSVFATAWVDLGDLALARGDGTTAMNAYRRSIFWLHDFTAPYVKAAKVLTSLEHTDDSCNVVDLHPRDGPLVDVVPDLATQLPHCKYLAMPWLMQMLRRVLLAYGAIVVGTLGLCAALYLCCSRRWRSSVEVPETLATPDRRRTKLNKKK